MRLGNILHRDYLILTGSSLLIAIAFMLPTAIHNNGMFLMRADFVGQQVCFITECKRLISTGSPWWSYNLGLGANFFGAYSFYVLGSPFFWLLMLVPPSWLPWAIGISIVLKFIVAAITAFWAIRLFVSRSIAIVGALLYTFSGFTIINLQFNHFTDVIAVFPLLILGLELLLRKHRYGFALFSLAVGINAIVNYYFFFAEILFIMLYVISRVILTINFEGRRICVLTRLAAALMLGMGLACVMLMPSIAAMHGNPRIGFFSLSIKDWLLFDRYRTLEIFRVFLMPIEGLVHHAFFPTTGWSSTGIYLPVFGMTLVIAYYTQRRDWLTRLILACMVISFVPLFNAAFSAFTNPWYTRWWFMLAFLLALGTAKALDELDTISPIVLRRSYMITLGLCIMIALPLGLFVLYPNSLLKLHNMTGMKQFVYYHDWITKDPYMGGSTYVLAAWLLCAVNYALLYVVMFRKRMMAAAIVSVIIASSLNAGIFVELENSRNSTQYYAERVMQHKGIQNPDNSYSWRIDYPHKITNYGLYVNQPSPNVFSSCRSANMADFQKTMRCGDPHDVYFLLPYNKPALRSLLSVKYFLNYDPNKFHWHPSGFDPVSKTTHLATYINRYFIPMGIAYDSYVSKDTLPQYGNCADKLMLNAAVLDDKQIQRYGEQMHQFTGDAARLTAADAWKADALRLRKHTCTSFIGNSRGFKARINLQKSEMVFFSIPFDPGWHAFIDGRPASIEKVNLGFLGLMIPSGNHSVKFCYFPPGLHIGSLVSIISALALTVCVLFTKKRSLFTK